MKGIWMILGAIAYAILATEGKLLTPFSHLEPKVELTQFPNSEPTLELTPFPNPEPKVELTLLQNPEPKLELNLFAPRALVTLRCRASPKPYYMEAGETAVFKSPRFPKKYPNRKRCGWHITSEDSSVTFEITCKPFKVQRPRRNRYTDFLRITDIGEDNAKMFAGRWGPNGWMSSGNDVSMMFRSNRRRRFRGFYCMITAIGGHTTESSSESSPSSYASPSPTVWASSSESSPVTSSSTSSSLTVSTSSSSGCKCGRVNRSTRIVGGQTTEVVEYPWQVAFVNKGSSKVRCGGSLINSRYVVTAAHCIPGSTTSNRQLLLGAHDLTSVTSSQRFNIASFNCHSRFSGTTLDNDICIVELSTEVDFANSPVRPICLPTSTSESYDSVAVTVTGWGTLSFGGVQPDELNEVDVQTMTNTQCQSSYGSSITDRMLCAGVSGGGKDSCSGDSGGPLITAKSDYFELIGIVSWGNRCALAGFPGVYTRVTEFLSWIAARSGDATTECPPN